MSTPSIIVIGAGAAGMMAAAEAAQRRADVVLLEKNGKTGVKILMSGGTRCNLTQDTDARGIVAAFGKGGRFLQKSVGAFGPPDVVKLFERLGVATKVESTGKIFPRSDRALHVRDALERYATESGARVRRRAAVRGVRRENSRWKIATDEGELACDRVIVTSGGKSWPGCGTTGDGYGWLAALGHTIVRPRPALVPLVGGNAWTRELSGLTLPDTTATVFSRGGSGKGRLIERRGSLLFTHFGFSGPVAMDVSGTMTAAESIEQVRLAFDFLPDVSEAELEQALTRRDRSKRAVASVLAEWLPDRLSDRLAASAGADQSLAELPKKARRALIAGLKRAEFPVADTKGFAKAEVTAGGVDLSEVNPKTMESRLQSGLYIAGEVLDLDGWIGGYNFQSAFSTGRAAGIAAAEPTT